MIFADLLHRLKALVLPGRWSRDLEEEMRYHIEQETAARVRSGADPAAARREARLAFGGVDRYVEETRDANGVRPLEEIAADVRFALRSLRRNSGFTLTVVGVLGLAIGATTAVFCVVHAVLLADLPYPDAGRLVRIYNQNSPINIWALSVVDLQALRDDHQSFESFGGARFTSLAMAGAGEPQQVSGVRATAGFFTTLGITPEAGRLIALIDETPGALPVTMVSHLFASSHFGAPAAALGKTITLDGIPYAIVGVLPNETADLAGMRASVWPVLQLPTPNRRGPFGYRGIARLKPGVTLGDAARDLDGLSARLYPIWQSSFGDKVAHFVPFELRRTIVGDSYRQLDLFGAAVALVLLVAIANVATLMLVRTSARAHELSVRSTLGASRPRLGRLVVTECLVLTGGATALGLAIAVLALRQVSQVAPDLPRVNNIVLNGPAVLVAIAIGVVSGVLVSLSPVIGVLRGTLTSWKSDLRRSGEGRRAGLIRGLLVSAEFALALPLLLGAGLLGNSFLRLQQVDPGYDPSRGFSIAINLPQPRYPDSSLAAFWRSVVARVTATPGVMAAGLSTFPPPDNQGDVNNFNLLAHPVPPGGAEPVAPWPVVSTGLFQALGVPLVEGRLFTETDTGATNPVIVVSRAWANRYFPGEPVLGQRLYSGGCYTCPPDVVVGVVGDVKYEGLAGGGQGVYSPLGQNLIRNATLIVRTSAAPASFIRSVTSALRGLDPQLPLAAVTLDDRLRQTLATPGRWTAFLTAFAVAALGLSAMGIFGLMSYVVRRQRREIGVRMALGAEPSRVTTMILGRGLRYVGLGTAAGLVLALLEARWIGALLYGVTPHDPVTVCLVIAVLLAAAVLACLLPGLRAARIRPLEAIAAE